MDKMNKAVLAHIVVVYPCVTDSHGASLSHSCNSEALAGLASPSLCHWVYALSPSCAFQRLLLHVLFKFHLLIVTYNSYLLVCH